MEKHGPHLVILGLLRVCQSKGFCKLNVINVNYIIGYVNMAKIKGMLLDSNPWWKGEYKIKFKEREIYKRLQKFMSSAISRVGLDEFFYRRPFLLTHDPQL